MDDPIEYSLEHQRGSVRLALSDGRLSVRTAGNGLLDRPRTVEVALSDLEAFAVVPTVGASHLVGGPRSDRIVDRSFDSELLLSWREGGKARKRRVFVNARSAGFRTLIEALRAKRPQASLLDLDPAEAHRRIGMISGARAVWVVVALLVGVPILLALAILALQ